ncbi:MAG: hypothetical protein FJY10_07080 [Bacteroidetes bacterium]|nr:hypothetical protein [Bacteroidota bacterium]
MKNRFLLLFLFLPCLLSSQALRIMHYNLLDYGNTNFCNASNNNTLSKNQYIRTIAAYVQPDVFTVNEIACNASVVDGLITAALNVSGVTHYARPPVTCFSSDKLANVMFYNSERVGYHSYDVVQTSVRDINIYKLYYKSPNLSITHDTAFFYVIVGHLKAGSDPDNATQRAIETYTLMSRLNYFYSPGNYLFMGDFNLYTNEEQAYQNLIHWTNIAIRFYDPVNKPGSWSGDGSFAGIHTQSTHSSGNGCASGGGMDDRFDFILASADIMQGNKHYRYIPGTYKALGQDGLHFNRSINSSPYNSSVPPDVLDAIYNNSDHLPLIIDIRYEENVGIREETGSSGFRAWIIHPVEEEVCMKLDGVVAKRVHIQLLSVDGRIIFENIKELSNPGQLNIPTGHLRKGLYFIRIDVPEMGSRVLKFIRQ